MKRILSIITGLLIIFSLFLVHFFIYTALHDGGLYLSMEFYLVFWSSYLVALFITTFLGLFISLKFFSIKQFIPRKVLLIILALIVFDFLFIYAHILINELHLKDNTDFISVLDMVDRDLYEVYWKRILNPLQLIISTGVVIFSAVKAGKKAFSKDDFNEVLDN